MFVLKDSSGKVLQKSKDGHFNLGREDLALGDYIVEEYKEDLKLGRAERRKLERLKRKKR